MKLMNYRPRGGEPTDKRLGRYVPDDWGHVDRYALSTSQAESLADPQPVVIGVNFYNNFFKPEKDVEGHWWIGLASNLGSLAGGHCMCLKPRGVADDPNWWKYYDQLQSSRCVQFGISRAMTLLNRKQYEIRDDQPDNRGWWLYYEAQRIDEWDGGEYPGHTGDQYGGTSVRAGLDVLRIGGLYRKDAKSTDQKEGIKENRWITSIDDCLTVLGYQDSNYVEMLNSWGQQYPHITRIPVDVLSRLWKEDGEFGVVTDR